MARSRVLFSVLLALGFVFATTQTANATKVPRLVTYQGLIPGGGNATVKIDVRFYKNLTVPDPLFSELHTQVQLNNGVFSILLGSETAGGLSSGLIVSTEAIGISINSGAELVPRILLTMVPFADRAAASEALVRSNSDRVVMKTLTSNTVQVVDSSSNVQFEFRTDSVNAAGEFKMFNATGTETVEILGGGGFDDSGFVTLRRADGTSAMFMAANAGLVGTSIALFSPTGQSLVLVQGAPTGGALGLHDSAGAQRILLNAPSTGGRMDLRDGAGVQRIGLDANGDSADGVIVAYADAGNPVFEVHTNQSGDNGQVKIKNQSGVTGINLVAFSGATGGSIFLKNGLTGSDGIRMWADNGGNDAEIWLRSNGSTTMKLIANDINGDSRVVSDVIEIVGGSDLSEQFDVTGRINVEPGMVVSIDPHHPGKLSISSQPYDKKVAGIVSGAGGVKPGMLMGQRGTIADGAHAVALTGRVWCYVDAGFGAIEPGDLLTTSNTPGHAMKVTDHANAQGAIVGKAMTALKADKGLVLVLVSLQ